MQSKKISIIIPTLNEERIIGRSLKYLVDLRDSIHKTPLETEIIVVDGSSVDKTRSIASKFADIVIKTHPGRGTQFNQAAIRASGDILLFLHIDTKLPRSALFDIFNAMKNPNVVGGGFFKDWDWPDDKKFNAIERLRNSFMRAFSKWLTLIFRIFPGDNAIFVRKSVFFELNGFRDMWICEDLDFSYRMRSLAAGYFHLQPKFIPRSKGYDKIVCLRHAVSTSARRFLEKGYCKVWAWWIGIFIGWRLGWPIERLRKRYGNFN